MKEFKFWISKDEETWLADTARRNGITMRSLIEYALKLAAKQTDLKITRWANRVDHSQAEKETIQ